jgi:hypothetical protein
MEKGISDFERVVRRTHCAFASSSTFDFAPQWNRRLSLRQNLRLLLPHFQQFCQNVTARDVDGLVVEVADKRYARDVAGLSSLLNQVLRFLSSQDPAQPGAMARRVEAPDWWFSFSNVRFFVLTFSPCYPDNHTRSVPGGKSCVIIFQPEEAFIRRSSPDTKRISDEARQSIRDAFAANAQPYDLAITYSPYEAYKYVKPLVVGASVVRWWET